MKKGKPFSGVNKLLEPFGIYMILFSERYILYSDLSFFYCLNNCILYRVIIYSEKEKNDDTTGFYRT